MLASNKNYSGLPLKAKAILAQAKFEDNLDLLHDFQSIKLDSYKMSVLGKKISLKLNKLNQVEAAYQAVLKYGIGEWAIPALFQLGTSFQTFAEALLNAPKDPKIKGQDEIMAYEEELQKYAIPLDDKGRAFFENAYQTVQKLGVYNEWSIKVYEKLNATDATQYPIKFEIGLSPKYQSEFVK